MGIQQLALSERFVRVEGLANSYELQFAKLDAWRASRAITSGIAESSERPATPATLIGETPFYQLTAER